MTISTILIANRGEIAVRIIDTAKRMGYLTVAIFTEPDRATPHTLLADQAVFLEDCDGSGEPYMDIDRIIETAIATDADAIHPGYGFLSENEHFANACADAGIVFIGPSAKVIAAMGDKAVSKRLMLEAGVPCVPGYNGEDQSTAVLAAQAREIGVPVLIKATAGGGGRGMRFVDDLSTFDEALQRARSEAHKTFGSDDVILERALSGVRHVEVQIAADSHGNIVHLGERDCSLQRRNQKVIEEAPSPVVDPALRARLGTVAVEVAAAVDYLGVGTVEFLLDSSGEFFFIEMNTRLQVEHPVTEEITGTDLVEWQLRIAAGEALPMAQDDIHFSGAAIEARLYAEDPDQEFLPQSGQIECWQHSETTGLRVDHMVIEGNHISSRYDPMIAKIIAHGDSRELARQQLLVGLRNLRISGLVTNRNFLVRLLNSRAFRDGAVDTAYVGRMPAPDWEAGQNARLHLLGAGFCYWLQAKQWGSPDDWSSLGPSWRQFRITIAGEHRVFAVRARGMDISIRENAGDDPLDFSLLLEDKRVGAITVGSSRLQLDWWRMGEDYYLDIADHLLTMTPENCLKASRNEGGERLVYAPMAGQIIAVEVNAGDQVTAGQSVLIQETMKMEHRIQAANAGVVGKIAVSVGQQVNRGDLLFEIEAQEQKGVE